MSPVWSPDEQFLAVSGRGFKGLYLFKVDRSSSVIQLTDETAAGYGVSWSPDGRWIATTVSRYEHGFRADDLVVFGPLDRSRRTIKSDIELPAGQTMWLEDGNVLSLWRRDSLMQFEVGTGWQLRKHSRWPKKKVAYLTGGQAYVKSDSGTQALNMELVPGEKLNLVQSPDGEKVAFEILGGALWVVMLATGESVNLGPGHRPSWHPDSNRLAYLVAKDDGHKFTSADLYAVNIDGTGKINLTATPDQLELRPAWSPSGRYIAFDTMAGEIFVLPVR